MSDVRLGYTPARRQPGASGNLGHPRFTPLSGVVIGLFSSYASRSHFVFIDIFSHTEIPESEAHSPLLRLGTSLPCGACSRGLTSCGQSARGGSFFPIAVLR